MFMVVAQKFSFNPRAHVGRDESIDNADTLNIVSIHAPTWGATYRWCTIFSE